MSAWGKAWGLAFGAAWGLVRKVIPEATQADPPAAGTSGDVGTGYIWRDNAWVKATKVAKVGISKPCPSKLNGRVSVSAKPYRLSITSESCKAYASTRQTLISQGVQVEQPVIVPSAHTLATSVSANVIVKSYNGACETLGLDELMVLLEITT